MAVFPLLGETSTQLSLGWKRDFGKIGES